MRATQSVSQRLAEHLQQLETPSPAAAVPVVRYGNGWGLISLLLAVHILNQIDRSLIASFGPQIVEELDLSRTQFGILTGIAFTAPYAIIALCAGFLADRHGRARIMATGLAIWSLFTALSGLAQSFLMLLIPRPFVASGEATLIPSATAMITTRFQQARHASVIGVFFAGIPLGLGGSYIVAASLGPLIGWRYCFMLLGAIGVGLSIAVWRLNHRYSGARALATSEKRLTLAETWQAIRALIVGNRRFRFAAISTVLLHAHVASAGFTQLWLTSDRGLDVASIGGIYGGFVMIFGTLGALTTGATADWASRRFEADRALTIALFLLVLAPLILTFRLAEPMSLPFYAGMAASAFFFTGIYGPSFAIIQAEVPDELRATVTGALILAINILVIGSVSLLIGISSDALVARGAAQTLTWPIVTADLLAFTAIGFLFAIARRPA